MKKSIYWLPQSWYLSTPSHFLPYVLGRIKAGSFFEMLQGLAAGSIVDVYGWFCFNSFSRKRQPGQWQSISMEGSGGENLAKMSDKLTKLQPGSGLRLPSGGGAWEITEITRTRRFMVILCNFERKIGTVWLEVRGVFDHEQVGETAAGCGHRFEKSQRKRSMKDLILWRLVNLTRLWVLKAVHNSESDICLLCVVLGLFGCTVVHYLFVAIQYTGKCFMMVLITSYHSPNDAISFLIVFAGWWIWQFICFSWCLNHNRTKVVSPYNIYIYIWHIHITYIYIYSISFRILNPWAGNSQNHSSSWISFWVSHPEPCHCHHWL